MALLVQSLCAASECQNAFEVRVGDLYITKCYMSPHPKSKFKTTFIITQRYGVWLSSLLTLFHGFPNPLDAEIDFFEVK